MFRTVADQVSLWEAVLPAELLRLPDELARVDALLDDEVFFGPFEPFFDPRLGRPSTPMEVYLRLMFLKSRYRLGYETLCREVGDSFTWRRFCRIPFDGAVPHPTTLMKLTTRCGSTAVDGLNRALLAKAVEGKVVRTNRVRADTTVVPANVAFPTDSGLLAKAVRRIGSNVKRIQAAGGAVRTRVRDRSRAAGRRAHGIAARLRSRAQAGQDDAKAQKLSGVQRITGELAGLAESAIADARKLLVNARRAVRRARVKAADLAAAGTPDPVAGRRRGRLVRAVNDLKRLIEATEKIIEQARQRINGIMPDGASRVVSLHDVQARPIAKGRLGKPVEFGFKGQFVDNEDGLVLDHTPSSWATRRTRRSSRRPSAGSPSGPGGRRGWWPRTAGTARPGSMSRSWTSGFARSSSRGRASRARPGRPSNTADRSAVTSSGGLGARGGSAVSSISTGGTAPGSIPWKGPGPGPGRACSPTTWSGSPT